MPGLGRRAEASRPGTRGLPAERGSLHVVAGSWFVLEGVQMGSSGRTARRLAWCDVSLCIAE